MTVPVWCVGALLLLTRSFLSSSVIALSCGSLSSSSTPRIEPRDVRTGYCETRDCLPCSSNSPVRTFGCHSAISFLPRVTNTAVPVAAAWREHSSSSSSLRSSSFCWWIWIVMAMSCSSSSSLVPWMAS